MTQKHHITYDPEWIMELTGWEHKAITVAQSRKASGKNMAKTTAMMHAL